MLSYLSEDSPDFSDIEEASLFVKVPTKISKDDEGKIVITFTVKPATNLSPSQIEEINRTIKAIGEYQKLSSIYNIAFTASCHLLEDSLNKPVEEIYNEILGQSALEFQKRNLENLVK